MKNIKLCLVFFLLVTSRIYAAGNENFTMTSPDEKLKTTIELNDKIYYSLVYGEFQIIDPSPISMELTDGIIWEKDPVARKKFNQVVKERTDYIAETHGMRTFPWRILRIATEDIHLLDTDMVYKLSSPQDENADFSWVQPGNVSWDWWCAVNLLGVDYRSGINTTSYKYCVDFALANRIEYINLDEAGSRYLTSSMPVIIGDNLWIGG